MIKILSAVLFTLSFSIVSLAESDHTPEACSIADMTICAHLGHMTELKSGSEVQFVTHILATKQISNLKIKLWMPMHQHGSSPVTVTQFGLNKYKVSKAYFTMAGTWEVQMTFELDGASHSIAIPLDISE